MTDAVNTATVTINEFLAMQGSRCAVLGRPVRHSLSPLLHTAGYRAAGIDMDYVRVEAGDATEIRTLMDRSPRDVAGFSVTMPGKAAALELADTTTTRARKIGVANTLVRGEDGRWLADNTDVDGILSCLSALESSGCSLAGSQAIVVGNGGTARPALAGLAATGVLSVTILARSDKALNLQPLVEDLGMSFSWQRIDDPGLEELCSRASVVINTVPPHAAERLAPALIRAQGIVDVVYDPYPTPLLTAARDAGIPVADGLQMLAGQAVEQFRLFTGQEVDPQVMRDAIDAWLKERQSS